MARRTITGTRIRERRLALGRRQVAVAAAAGISASYLNLIEHGRRAIGGGLLARIAAALDTDQSALSEDGDAALAREAALAGAARGLPPPALAQASELARRHPDWARLVAAQAAAIEAGERRAAALLDRLGHDADLAEALHELLSAVATVRSTASILAQTPEIDRNWLGRFHAILDEDSRRLADGASAVVARLGADAGAPPPAAPAEAAERAAAALGERVEALAAAGGDPEADAATLAASIADPAVRAAARGMLACDLRDAARLPRAVVAAARAPDDLLAAAGGDVALALRRMAACDARRGLLVADAAGAILRRRAVAGFALPAHGPGCALWPLHRAMSRPGEPLAERLETPDGARWMAHAVAAPAAPPAFGAAPVLRSTMLLTRADGPGPATGVGPTCRACPRAGCPARREPSLLAPVEGMAGHGRGQGGETGGTA